MPRIATTSPVWGASVAELRELARIAEGAGFEAIYSPEVPPWNGLSNAQVFAEATSKIKVGTWIANIYTRMPVVAAGTALTIQEITSGRMVLGLGVSHKPVNDRFGIDMGDPIEKMREYVTSVRSFMDGTAPQLTLKRNLPKVPIYIAGLTKGAATLAGEVADGIFPYLSTPEYVKTLRGYVAEGAKNAGRDPSEIDITLGIPVFISDDIELARTSGKRGLSNYLRLPFYQRMVRNNGFGDVIDAIQGGANPVDVFSDELLDAIALVGPADRCRARLEDYTKAGVDLAVILPGGAGKQTPVEAMKVAAETFGADSVR